MRLLAHECFAGDSPSCALIRALLRGDPPPAVPQAYVERFAALRQALM